MEWDSVVAASHCLARASDPAQKSIIRQPERTFNHGPALRCFLLWRTPKLNNHLQVLSESLLWMTKAIDEFTLQPLQVQTLIDWVKVSHNQIPL